MGRFDAADTAHRAFYDVVFVFEPRKEARHDAADIVDGDLAGTSRCLVVIEVPPQVIAFDLGVGFGKRLVHMVQGGLVVLEGFGRAAFYLLGSKEKRKQVLARLGLPGAESLSERVSQTFELVRFEDGLHLREYGVDDGFHGAPHCWFNWYIGLTRIARIVETREVAHMVLDWEIIASCVTAIVAILALFVSLKQGRMANRQRLFDRRLKIWIITEKLMQLYQSHSGLLKKDDEPQFAIDICFEWLTNTTFLQDISPAIWHMGDNEYQLKFHLKIDEMKSLSTEAAFVFKGRPKTAIAEFIDAYQALLCVIYRYQIVLDAMQTDMAKFHWMLEEAIEKLGEEQHRAELYDAEDRLAAAYDELSVERMAGKIRRQIRLDSTPVDYFRTFF